MKSLTVTVTLPTGVSIQSDAVDISNNQTTPFTLQVAPQAAPGEALSDGTSRDVGQLSVNFAMPELHGVNWNWARVYLNSSKDIISTNEKDKKSAFEADMGIERTLSSWYFPYHLQVQTKGNQKATDLSFLVGAGATTVIPWSWTKKAFYGPVLQIPVSPSFSGTFQYERRIRQDAASLKSFPKPNDVQLNPSLSWGSIALLPGLLKAPITPGMEIDLGAWYLPTDLTKSGTGTQKFEGYGDVSLLLPLPLLEKFVPGAGFLLQQGQSGSTSPASSTTQIRIKYSDSVNSASGFARTKQWTYGVEVIK